MCGIAGFVGSNAEKVVHQSLKKLEYRGYDSWGLVSMKEKGVPRTAKYLGAPSQVQESKLSSFANISIGHTRWATHGEVSIKNTHPIKGNSKSLCWVVHNGIIENSEQLKAELSEYCGFITTTDTEALSQLLSLSILNERMAEQDIVGCIKNAVSMAKGDYAFLMMNLTLEGLNDIAIIGFSRGSPLCLSNNGHVSSDPSVFSSGSKYLILPHNHLFILKINGDLDLYDLTREFVSKEPYRYNHTAFEEAESEKSSGSVMLDEILSQGKISELPSCSAIKNVSFFNEIILLGCGSSYNAGLIGRHIFESAGIRCQVEYASEFNRAVFPSGALFVPISQSGETKDVLNAVESIKRYSGTILPITNNPNSTLARMYPSVILNCGKEEAVAATKTFSSTLYALALLAGEISGNCGVVKSQISDTIEGLNKVFSKGFLKQIKSVSDKIVSKYKNVLFLGKGKHYAIAREAALKLKEVSYIHAEAMPAAEMKHGPIALIDKDTLSIFIDLDEDNKIHSNISEVVARGGKTIVLTRDNSNISIPNIVKVEIPDYNETIPAVSNAVFQLIAYYTAIKLGINPDKPRNLAKSVTVG